MNPTAALVILLIASFLFTTPKRCSQTSAHWRNAQELGRPDVRAAACASTAG